MPRKKKKDDTKNQIDTIVDTLEACYTGARMCDDTEGMEKISRAIAALKAPLTMEIFTKEFQVWYKKHCYDDENTE